MSDMHAGWHGRRVIVTGAAGFIGANVVRALVRAGAQVVAVVREHTSLDPLGEVVRTIQVERWDVTAPACEALGARVGGADVVMHLAAGGTHDHGRDLRQLVDVNVLGAVRALEMARQAGARVFLHAGSATEYGAGVLLAETAPLQPKSNYGVTKTAGWLAVRARAEAEGLAAISLRLFTPYGPFEGRPRLVPHVVLHALRGDDIPLTPARQTRDWLFVDDAVEAFLRAGLRTDLHGEVFNICSGEEVRVLDVAETIVRLTGGRVRVVAGATPYRPDEPMRSSGDPSHAAAVLGWRAATPLEEGLRRALAWWEQTLTQSAAVGGGSRA